MVNSYEIKAELLKELALEVGQVTPDLGIRAGVDSRHPIYRGKIVTSFASWDLLDLQRRREISKSIVHALEEFGGHAGIGRQSGGLTDAHTRAHRTLLWSGVGATIWDEGPVSSNLYNSVVLGGVGRTWCGPYHPTLGGCLRTSRRGFL